MELQARLDALEAENAVLRDALDFYASSSNWRREVRNLGPRKTWIKSKAAFDKGTKAKFTLMTLEHARSKRTPS